MALECTQCTVFQGADGDTDRYRMFAEVTDRLAGSKQAAQKFNL